MAPDEKELLQKTYDLSIANNKILHAIRRSNRISASFTFLYWILIIGISFGAFYFLQPYVGNILNAYNSIQGDMNVVKTVAGKLPNATSTQK